MYLDIYMPLRILMYFSTSGQLALLVGSWIYFRRLLRDRPLFKVSSVTEALSRDGMVQLKVLK